jgi:hypothetical protein
VLQHLQRIGDAVLKSAWPAIRRAIEVEPIGFIEALGLAAPEAPQRRLRSFTDIMISAGKGPKQEPERETL